MFVIVAVEESTPADMVISEPLQIIVATPDEVMFEKESTADPVEDVEYTDETIREY